MSRKSNKQMPLVIGIVLLTFFVSAFADTLVLKDGRVLQGTFKGGTETAIKFEVNGKVQEVPLSEITTLTISPRAAQPPAAPAQTGGAAATGAAATTAAAPASQAAGPVTVPAGTKIMLKTTQTISTASHKQGAKVTAALEADLVVNGVVAAPKGTTVYGKVLESTGGRRVGKQRLVITFTELSIKNQLVPIVTDDVGAEGAPGGAARKVGAGALVGAAAGDAAAGAAVGGALALLGPGGQVQVPAGSLVEVSLKQPVTVQK